MFYKNFLYITLFLFLSNCTVEILLENKPKVIIQEGYSNRGFALIYSEDIYKKKIVNKKIDERILCFSKKSKN